MVGTGVHMQLYVYVAHIYLHTCAQVSLKRSVYPSVIALTIAHCKIT
jgi:hypothetical protein